MNESLPKNNLGLYRLTNFVGRNSQLKQLKTWLQHNPVVALTGPSGVGKSTLATALAIKMASAFDEGIVYISAMGDTPFNFYDIVRTLEDVLAPNIAQKPSSAWPLLVRMQLYGFKRLLILDELTEADETATDNIVQMISQIGPGGPGRFVLIGRSLPKALLDLAGDCHLVLDGLGLPAVQSWVDKHAPTYTLTQSDGPTLHHHSYGYPLALKLMAWLWHTQAIPKSNNIASTAQLNGGGNQIRNIVVWVEDTLNRTYPQANELLRQCSQASGGFDIEAIENLYWHNWDGSLSLSQALNILLACGFFMYQPQTQRYFIHPLIRRYVSETKYQDFSLSQQSQYNLDYATYYLDIAQRYQRLSATQWALVDADWGNVRQAFNFLVAFLERELSLSVIQALAQPNLPNSPALAPDIEAVLDLIKDYALALLNYIARRHPPEGVTWLAAGVIASRSLTDVQAEALIGERLGAIAYYNEDYETASTWYQHSLGYYENIGDQTRTIRLSKDLATVLSRTKQTDKAIEVLLEALRLTKTHNDLAEQAGLQARIASIYYRQDAYDQALKWYNQALALDTANHNGAWQAIHHNNLGLVYEAKGEFTRAIQHYEKSATLHQKYDNHAGLSTAYANLGASHYELGQLKEALLWYERDLDLTQQAGNWLDIASTLHNLGQVCLELNDDQTAKQYLSRSRDIYAEFGLTDLAGEEQSLLDSLGVKI